MKTQNLVEMSFYCRYSNNVPWQRGMYTKPVIRFSDKKGRVAGLIVRMEAAQRNITLALERVLRGKGRLSTLFWHRISQFHTWRERCLRTAARNIVVKLLKKAPPAAFLQREASYGSGTFKDFEASWEREDLANKLKKAPYFWFKVLEPA